MADKAKIAKLLRQQAALASFGSFALDENDLLKILNEAARVCAEGLGAHYCKVCRYRADTDDLLVEAGYGWKSGVVGNVVSVADESSPQGRAFITGEPAVCDDLRKEQGFELPAFYGEHGIISTIDVPIKGKAAPYGVLEIDSDKKQNYDQHDIDFLTGFANVLAAAVATARRAGVLQKTIACMKDLVEEKDRLLSQKKILAQELQHRVRNNLQLVYGMLSKQIDDTVDEAGQRGIRAISRRVSTLAQVYDQLLGTEMGRTMDFGEYVKSLCTNLADVQVAPDNEVTLECQSESILLDLDVVTSLGIVVAELTTNSFDHAFPEGKGKIEVILKRAGGGRGAILTIEDDGEGFTPVAGSKRHGLGLVRRLVEQVEGTVTLVSQGRTLWTIEFPVPAPAEPEMSAALS